MTDAALDRTDRPRCIIAAGCHRSRVADVLSGTVTARVRQGVTAATAVVYAEPLEGSAPARPAPPAAIEQRGKAFTPRVLAVPVGTEVRFPNSDGIFHNVFSLSSGNVFDLGLYRSGDSKSRTLTTPGVRAGVLQHPSADDGGRRRGADAVGGRGRGRRAPGGSSCRPAGIG